MGSITAALYRKHASRPPRESYTLNVKPEHILWRCFTARQLIYAIAYSGCFNVNVFLISKSIGSAMKS